MRKRFDADPKARDRGRGDVESITLDNLRKLPSNLMEMIFDGLPRRHVLNTDVTPFTSCDRHKQMVSPSLQM